LTTLITSSTYSGHKQYYAAWNNENQRAKSISSWVSLVKGEKYYLRGAQANYGGGGYYSVGVEIKRTLAADDTTVHHQSAKEVRYLGIEPAQTFEKTNITLSLFDEGEYRLQFQDPVNETYWFSEAIPISATT
jgi:hypothetical protein